MVPISKVVGVVACSFLLGLGLSNVTQANDNALTENERPAEKSDTRGAGQVADKTVIIKGELLRVIGEDYFVKAQNGKEVRLHVGQSTRKMGNISNGDHIEAKVNENHDTLAIRSVP